MIGVHEDQSLVDYVLDQLDIESGSVREDHADLVELVSGEDRGVDVFNDRLADGELATKVVLEIE